MTLEELKKKWDEVLKGDIKPIKDRKVTPILLGPTY